AQGPAHRAAGPVRRHQQPRRKRLFAPVLQRQAQEAHAVGDIIQAGEPGRPVTREAVGPRQPRLQRVAEIAGHHHLAEGLAPVFRGFQPGPAEIAGAGHVDAADRRRRERQRLHHAQRGERVNGGLGEAQVALVEHRRQRARRRGLDQRHILADARQRDRPARTDQAAADDHDIVLPDFGLPGCGARLRVLGHGCAMLPVPRQPASMMNRSAPTMFAPGPIVLAVLILLAALSRLLPHPPNFSPVEAIALFGGAYFASRAWAFAVPMLALLASDLVMAAVIGDSYLSYLGGVSFWSVYACIG